MSKVYLVTGANHGLGLEAVRQLALLDATRMVYLACRSETKAQSAIDDLVTSSSVPGDKLQYVHFDASDSEGDISKSIVGAVELLPLNGLILNAGGYGHDTSRKPTGPNQILDMHQINLIGNIQLLELLRKSNLLIPNECRIIYSGSEAARGVKGSIPNPPMGDDVDWYRAELKGETTTAPSPMQIYSTTKGIAALYFAAWARRHPEYHVLTVSPGGTTGTGCADGSAKGMSFVQRYVYPLVIPVLGYFGLMHNVQTGANRYVRAVIAQDDMAEFASGTFVASASPVSAIGKVCDQTELEGGRKYGDRTKQEAAFAALSEYVGSSE